MRPAALLAAHRGHPDPIAILEVTGSAIVLVDLKSVALPAVWTLIRNWNDSQTEAFVVLKTLLGGQIQDDGTRSVGP
jgi:hypothetical protein